MIRFGTIVWKQDDSTFLNKLVVQLNPDVAPPETATFQGDGTTTSFTLPKAASQVIGAALIQGTTGIQAYAEGDFHSVPNPGDTVTIGAAAYEFVAALDNTVFGQVLIGPDIASCALNLAYAIDKGPGTDYSSATWANPDVLAVPAPTAIVLTAKALGTVGNSVALLATGSAFSWSAASCGGGSPVGGASLRVGPAGTGAYDLSYTPGSPSVSTALAPASGTSLVVTYRASGGNTIAVSNGAASTLGLGSNFQIYKSGATTLAAALAEAGQLLAAYSKLPTDVIYDLADEVTGLNNAVLSMGQQVFHEDITAPAEAGALLAGEQIVQAITGTLPSERWEKLAEPYGHFRYTMEYVNTLDVSTYHDTLAQATAPSALTTPVTANQQIASGLGTGAGGSTGGFTPFMRDALLKDLTVGDDVIDSVLITTPITAMTSPPQHAVMQGVRIAAVVRTGITLTADLTVRFKKTTVTSPTTSMSWTVTIPSGWAPNSPLEWSITGTFYDLDILSLDILASDGQTDKDGVCSLFIEWD